MTQGNQILILLFLLMAGSKVMFGRRPEPKIVTVISIFGCLGIGVVVALSIQASSIVRLGIVFLVAAIGYFWFSFGQYLRRGQPL